MVTINQQLIAFYTIIRRELVRMFRIASQVFLPPVITTLLYFLIFGAVIGDRIGDVDGTNYATFIAPGLIMIAVITNAYSNVSTSLFSARFQKNIEEMLVSSMLRSVLLLGYILSGILRGVLVGALVYIVACLFLDMDFSRIPMTLFIVLLVSALFALAGFANGIMARTFDDVAIVPTFILTPLTYLGGVFYATSMLPPFWQKLSYFNPIVYMVSALREAMIGHQEINMIFSISIIGIILILLIIFNMVLLKKGVGLHD